LEIGLTGFVPESKPIANRLQVANLPHGAAVLQIPERAMQLHTAAHGKGSPDC